MRKKGQISIFIIAGIVLILLLGLALLIQGKSKLNTEMNPETGKQESASMYFSACHKESVLNAKKIYGIGKEQEQNYKNYIEEKMMDCIARHPFQGVEVNTAALNSDVAIGEDSINVETTIPVTVRDGGQFKAQFDKLNYNYKLQEYKQLPVKEGKTTAETSMNFAGAVDIKIPAGTRMDGNPQGFISVKSKDRYSIITDSPDLAGDEIYELSPYTQFSQPVEISVDYSKISLTDDVLEDKLRLFTFDTEANKWVLVENSRADAGNKKVIASINHFSEYAVGEYKLPEIKVSESAQCTMQDRINYLCGSPCDNTCSAYVAKNKDERRELQALIEMRRSGTNPSTKIEGTCNLDENCLKCPDKCQITTPQPVKEPEKQPVPVQPQPESPVQSPVAQSDCAIQARIDYLCGKCNKGDEDNGIGPYNPTFPSCNIVWGLNSDELNKLGSARGKGLSTVKEAIDNGYKIQSGSCSCSQTTSPAPSSPVASPPVVTPPVASPPVVPAPEPTKTEVQEEEIGQSVEKRPIKAYKLGNGNKKVLIVGGIHSGTEGNGVDLAERIKEHYTRNPDKLPSDETLWIITNANPDGRISASRFNKNSVDLNRNWDTPDWLKDTYSATNTQKPGGGGTAPFSEPETQAISKFLLNEQIDYIISYHSAGATVDAGRIRKEDGTYEISGSAKTIGEIYARRSGYTYLKEGWTYYPITGSLIDWAVQHNIPGVDVELKSKVLTPQELEDNKAAVGNVLAYVHSTAVT